MPFNPEWYKETARFARPDVSTASRRLLTAIIPYLVLMALMALTVRRGYPYAVTLAVGVAAAAIPNYR